MRIVDRTQDRLTLVDDQADKRLALKIVGALMIVGAVVLSWNGLWLALPLAAAGIAGLAWYGTRSRTRSEITFDKPADSVTLEVEDSKGAQDWHWALADVRTAEVHSRGKSGSDSGIERPDLVLTDGTRVPMRPYHSAGTQSWNAVAAIKLFLGQDLDDAPVGWLPPEEFDRLFAEEMARHNK